MPKGAQGEANKKGRAICHPSRLEVLGATFHARLRVHIVRSRNARRDDRLYDKTQANELFEGGAKFALTDSELVGGVLRRHPERLGLLVNYCLDCGTSKTLWHRSCPDCEMGYYLGYRTSETRI